LKTLKKLRGRVIKEARFWKNDCGEVALELSFEDGKFFCLNISPPSKLESKIYFDDEKEWSAALVSDNRPMKEYK
jgi:hypothetical protein